MRYLLRIQYKYPSIATRGTCASIANGIVAVVVAVSDVAAVGVQRIMRLIGSKCGNFYNKQRGTWCVCVILYFITLYYDTVNPCELLQIAFFTRIIFCTSSAWSHD